MSLSKLLNRLLALIRSKAKKNRDYERESFHARLAMEQQAQRELEARLKYLELLARNQERR